MDRHLNAEASRERVLIKPSLISTMPELGFVRLPAIIAPKGPLPISRALFWEWVRDGRFPKPIKLGPRISAWRVEDVRATIDQLSRGS